MLLNLFIIAVSMRYLEDMNKCAREKCINCIKLFRKMYKTDHNFVDSIQIFNNSIASRVEFEIGKKKKFSNVDKITHTIRIIQTHKTVNSNFISYCWRSDNHDNFL